MDHTTTGLSDADVSRAEAHDAGKRRAMAKSRAEWRESKGSRAGSFRELGVADARIRFFEWEDGGVTAEITADGDLLTDLEVKDTSWKAFAQSLREA